jgi:hypothetical protein
MSFGEDRKRERRKLLVINEEKKERPLRDSMKFERTKEF